jgi:hypothetical protein
MNGSEGDHAFVLLNDETEYWRRCAESLIAPAASPGLAVLTRDVEARPGSFPAPVVAAGAELAAVAAGGDVERAEALAARLRGERAIGRPEDWVLGVGRSAALGLVRALSDGRPFLAVERLDDARLPALGRRASSVYVVGDQMGAEEVAALQRALDASARREILPGVPACPVGCLHGRDLAMMTFLDAKQRSAALSPPRAGIDVVVDCTLSRAPADPLDDLAVMPYEAVTRDAIARHPRIRLLAITAHGMSDLIHLNGDYVCGKSRYIGALDPDSERQPSCMDEDGRCFLKPEGTALLAHEVPAEHVFANSCGSMRFRAGDFGTRFNVWYAALEGRARSFVGSTRLKDGHGLEGLLYRQLLVSGYSLGEAVALLNRAIGSNQIERSGDVYVLLGDPAERLAGAAPPGSGLALRTVGDPELVRALAAGQLLVTAGDRRPFFWSAVPARDGTAFHLFLYGYSGVSQDGSVETRSFQAERDRVADVQRAIEENLSPALGLHGLYPDRVRQGGRRNLEQRLLSVARLSRARFTDPGAAGRLQVAYRRLLEDLDRTDAEVAAWLEQAMRRTRYRLAEHYQDTFVLGPDAAGSRCYICGGEVIHRTLQHAMRPTLRRVERVCGACGVIEDTPDPSLVLTILMDDEHPRGCGTDMVLRLANTGEREWSGHCAAAVRRGLTLPVAIDEPVRPVVVRPRSTVEVTFPVLLGDALRTHQYEVQAVLVSATRIFVAKRPFWIVPSA